MANQYRSVLASGASTGGDAVASEVLTGKTFTNDNGPQTGSMPNRGAVSQNLSAGESYTIPEGYHNGSGVITDISPAMLTTPRKYLVYGIGSTPGVVVDDYVSGQEVTGYAGGSSNAIINVKGITGNLAYAGDTSSGVRYLIIGMTGNTATIIQNVVATGNVNFSDYDYLIVAVSHSGTSTLKFTITES